MHQQLTIGAFNKKKAKLESQHTGTQGQTLWGGLEGVGKRWWREAADGSVLQQSKGGRDESDESGSLNDLLTPAVPAVSACNLCIDHPPFGSQSSFDFLI